MSTPETQIPKNVIPLRLPDLGDEGQPGASFVKRAVTSVLGVILLLAGGGVVASALVTMDVTVKTSGILEPVRLWPVRAQAAGVVRDVAVRSGDTVQAGDTLARMDALQLETQLSQLEAQLRAAQIERERAAASTPMERAQQSEKMARARARLTTSRATLLQRMVEHGVGTNVDSLLAAYRPGQHVTLDLAVGEVRGAEADIRLAGTETDMLSLRGFDQRKTGTEIDRLEAQASEARQRITRSVVIAPATGVVLTDDVDRRLSGVMVREGETLLEVGDLGDWRVTMMVSERDVNKIKPGDRVRLEVQAFEQRDRRQLEGRVSHVSAEPSTGGSGPGAGGGASAGGQGGGGPAPAAASSGPGLYRVVASLDRNQIDRAELQRFRRGYSVRANVVTRSGRILELAWAYVADKLERK